LSLSVGIAAALWRSGHPVLGWLRAYLCLADFVHIWYRARL